jgi:hypothetical protein
MVRTTNKKGTTSVQYGGSDAMVKEYEQDGIKRDAGSRQTLVDLYLEQQNTLSDTINLHDTDSQTNST